MTAKKLYEAKDASINISAEIRWTRCLLGAAYTEAPFTKEVRMRMLALHFGCVCLTFTRFFLRDATPEEINKEMERRGRNVSKGKKRL